MSSARNILEELENLQPELEAEVPPLVVVAQGDEDPFHGADSSRIFKQLESVAARQGWRLNRNGGDKDKNAVLPVVEEDESGLEPREDPDGLHFRTRVTTLGIVCTPAFPRFLRLSANSIHHIHVPGTK